MEKLTDKPVTSQQATDQQMVDKSVKVPSVKPPVKLINLLRSIMGELYDLDANLSGIVENVDTITSRTLLLNKQVHKLVKYPNYIELQKSILKVVAIIETDILGLSNKLQKHYTSLCYVQDNLVDELDTLKAFRPNTVEAHLNGTSHCN